MSLLEVKNLHVEVDGKNILNGLDLVIEKGSVHAHELRRTRRAHRLES